jgi:hypothetical protein
VRSLFDRAVSFPFALEAFLAAGEKVRMRGSVGALRAESQDYDDKK